MLKQLEISEYGVSMRSMFTKEERAEFRAKEDSLVYNAKKFGELNETNSAWTDLIAAWTGKKELMLDRVQRRYERLEHAKMAE